MNAASADPGFIYHAVDLQIGLSAGGCAIDDVVARLNRERAGPELVVAVSQTLGKNAFTLPGRHVYLGAELANGVEALAAFVVAHEMSHHDLGHIGCADRFGKMSDDGGAATLRALASCTAHTLEQEVDADRHALELCHSAGFSESGVREAFAIFERLERDVKRRQSRRTVPEAVTALEVILDKVGIVRPSAPIALRRRNLWAVAPGTKSLPSRYGLSSTRMTFACESCAARFGPQSVCPRCGSTTVFSLADSLARARVLGGIHTRRPPWTVWYFVWALACLFLGMCHAVPVVLAAAVGIVAAVQGWLRETEGRAAGVAFRPVPAAPRLPAGQTMRIKGQVRVVRPVTSPEGVSCAVWQVRGETPWGRLDDAGVGRFDIVDAGRIVARVECDDALVDLGRNRELSVRAVDEGLKNFLAPRGDNSATCVRVAESILADGDEVEVTGLIDLDVEATGLREVGFVPRFNDWPSIRRIGRIRRSARRVS